MQEHEQGARHDPLDHAHRRPGQTGRRRSKEAAKRGYDPNVWFHNVEYIAAERIGHETVTYVSNIFKYYVAYRLIGDALEERRGVRESQER